MMECFSPVKIYLSDEAIEKRKERTDMPVLWRYSRFVYVPCGKCPACLSRRRSMWSTRLHYEVQNSLSCYFVTLTYDDDYLPTKIVNRDGEMCFVPVVCKRDLQLFLKRFRKLIDPFKIRYFAVSEYGPQNLRPHYHMLIFNYPNELYAKLHEYLERSWSNGFIRLDPVNAARINYVTSYCLDSSTLPKYLDKNFMLCSRRPGLGASFLDNDALVSYHRLNADGFCYLSDGSDTRKVKMPRYYSDRIFSDDEKQQVVNKGVEHYREQRIKLYRRQRDWLERRGIPVDDVTLYTPYDGSPVKSHMDSQGEFRRAVEKKCKLKNRIKDE